MLGASAQWEKLLVRALVVRARLLVRGLRLDERDVTESAIVTASGSTAAATDYYIGTSGLLGAEAKGRARPGSLQRQRSQRRPAGPPPLVRVHP